MRNLTPYEQLEVNTSGTSVLVVTPWIKLDCDIKRPAVANKSGIVQELYRYPVCYIHPRRPERRDAWRAIKAALMRCPRRSLEETVRKLNPKFLDMSWTKGTVFKWDVHEVLNFSRIGSLEVFDALSAYSVVRRVLHHSLVDLGESELNTKLQQLKAHPEIFKEAVATYIYQNFYITSRCVEALRPAVDHLPTIKGKLSAYITAESGHDKLTQKSLNALGYSDLNQLTLFPETKMLIEILKFSSSAGVLAFTSLIDFFESGSTSGVHPLSKLLKDTPFASAGAPLQRHRDINAHESHSSIAFDFLLTPATCTAKEVYEAVNLTELAVLAKRGAIAKLTALADALLKKAHHS